MRTALRQRQARRRLQEAQGSWQNDKVLLDVANSAGALHCIERCTDQGSSQADHLRLQEAGGGWQNDEVLLNVGEFSWGHQQMRPPRSPRPSLPGASMLLVCTFKGVGSCWLQAVVCRAMLSVLLKPAAYIALKIEPCTPSLVASNCQHSGQVPYLAAYWDTAISHQLSASWAWLTAVGCSARGRRQWHPAWQPYVSSQ